MENNGIFSDWDLPSTWYVTTLGEVCQSGGGYIQTGPFGSQLHAADYVPVGIPTIMPVNIGDNRVIADGIARITEEDADRLKRHRLQPGDIVYSRRGDIERKALIREEETGWLCGTGCLKVHFGDHSSVDPVYASYFLGHPDVKAWIVAHAVGTIMPNLNTGILSSVPFIVPPLKNQKYIAHILGNLDAKIELNRRMNRTLEEMAAAIFKSWFVDFDPVVAKAEGRRPVGMGEGVAGLFPDRFSEDQQVPVGWKIGKLLDIALVIDCLHSKKPERRETGKILLQLNNIRNDALLDLSEKFYISETDYQHWISRFETREGDCVITNVGRVGAVAQIPPNIKVALGRNMTGIRVRGDFRFPTFLIQFLVSDVMKAEIALKTDAGTILDALNVKNIPELKIIVPSIEVAAAFEKIVRPLRAKMEQNLIESINLSTIRDTLLPKLLSGELRLNEP